MEPNIARMPTGNWIDGDLRLILLDNVASRKKLEYFGARYVDTQRVAHDSPYASFYPVHARTKRR